MTIDAQGLTVTGADDADIAAIDAFVHGLLAYDLGIVKIRDAPHKPVMVCVFTGVLHLLAETRGAEATALPWRDAAHAARAGVTPREDQWIGVLDHWCAGDIQATVAALDALVLAYPRDLAALKLLHYHHFNRGEFAGMLRAALHVQRTVGDVPYLGGMLAFAYEQLHLLDAAEAAARTGLALEPGDPWAQHALAHVWLTRGRIDEGLAALEGWSPGWTGLNSFMVTHLWWHLALFHLSKGHFDRALAIYDDHAWGYDRTYSQDQVGAVSLLARLDMAGIAVGDRWADLGTWLAVRAEDAALPFLAVQYAYGLARAGRPEADRLVSAIAARAGDPDPVWRARGSLHDPPHDPSSAAADRRLDRPARAGRSGLARGHTIGTAASRSDPGRGSGDPRSHVQHRL